MAELSELFFLLLVGHLIADFPLQTNKLVAWKKTSKYGIAAHSMVGVIVTGALILPYLDKLWPALIAIGLTHYWIDGWKINVEKKKEPGFKGQLSYFIADQVLHIFVIFIIANATSFFLGQRGLNVIGQGYLSHFDLPVVIVLIWFIFGQSVLNQVILNAVLNEMRPPFFTGAERYGGMLFRGIGIGLCLVNAWLGIIVIAAFLVALNLRVPQGRKYWGRRYRLGMALNVISIVAGTVVFHFWRG
ncbi:hypothetical protein GGQ84_001007 [Desulfitispora alkaliphila]|uniref:DUF3307 domain-containing protein n=1 Tax=Desulfitispora alkaliphila TaxID=622674 RepID=UPI003D1BCBD3